MRGKKLQSKEIQEQMGNKVIDIYQSEKGYKAISEALGLQWTPVRAIIHKWMKKTWNSGEPSQEWPNKSTPRGHQQLIQEATKEAWTPYKTLQASLEWFNNMKETGQKWHPWESSKAKTTADQKERPISHLSQNILMIPIISPFGKILCGLTKQKWNFLQGVHPITCGIKITQHLRKRTSY